MTEVLRVSDFRANGMCAPALRREFNAAGVDFREFCRNGMPMEEVEKHLPNAFIERAILTMRERLKADVSKQE